MWVVTRNSYPVGTFNTEREARAFMRILRTQPGKRFLGIHKVK